MNDFQSIFQKMPLWSLAIAFGIYVLQSIFRALRFRVLLATYNLPLGKLLCITFYHQFLTRSLPIMIGEISYIALIKKYLEQPVIVGISSLLSARLFESIFIFLGFGWGVLMVKRPFFQDYLLMTYFVVLIIIILLFAGIYFGSFVFKIANRAWIFIFFNSFLRNIANLQKIADQLKKISQKFENNRKTSIFWPALILSFFTYGTGVSYHLLLLYSAGVDQNIDVMLIIISIVFLALWFPFSISGFGPVEGSWTFGLMKFAGFGLKEAVSLGLFLHGFQVIVISFSGIIGYYFLLRSQSKKYDLQIERG